MVKDQNEVRNELFKLKEIKHGWSADLKNLAADTAPMLETRMKTANLTMEEQRLRLLLIDP